MVQHEPPVILARPLSHPFATSDVFHDIYFAYARREIFGFIGPNGAGKTTPIRAMATLLDPWSGHIEIDGIDVGLEPERVRPRIGYMADQAGIYPKLTVDEYLSFFAAMFGLDIPQAVDRALDLVGLGAARGEMSGTLSKGMRQRLQLAKTVLHDPEVLVLDEPASDLDPRARIEMRDLFLRLCGAKKTIFLSSHILTELSDVCTSVGIIEKGHLVASGPVARISEELERRARGTGASGGEVKTRRYKIRTLRPADMAFAALSGVAGGSVVRASGDLVIVAAGGDERLPAPVERPARGGGRVGGG